MSENCASWCVRVCILHSTVPSKVRYRGPMVAKGRCSMVSWYPADLFSPLNGNRHKMFCLTLDTSNPILSQIVPVVLGKHWFTWFQWLYSMVFRYLENRFCPPNGITQLIFYLISDFLSLSFGQIDRVTLEEHIFQCFERTYSMVFSKSQEPALSTK